jgi:hypothetical protein
MPTAYPTLGTLFASQQTYYLQGQVQFLGFEGADSFSEEHKNGFRRAVAQSTAVPVTQVVIESVIAGSRRHRQLLDSARMLSQKIVAVSYTINGLRRDESIVAQAAFADIAYNASSFLIQIVAAFADEGAAVPAEMFIGANIPTESRTRATPGELASVVGS